MAYDYSKVRAVPKVPMKKINRKRKKQEEYHGVKIPHRKKRSAISKQDYQDAIDHHGEVCVRCSRIPIQLHHLRFRSQSGRSGYRNLLPLCQSCHSKAHRSFEFAESLRYQARIKYGIWYWADKFDLWKEGLISSPEEDKFQKFMKEEEERARALKNNEMRLL